MAGQRKEIIVTLNLKGISTKVLLGLATLVALALTARFVSLPLRAAEKPPPPGTIITVAGTGIPAYSGDAGPAVQPQLHTPSALAVDARGNLFIADHYNRRVRRVDAVTGIITTVAGNGHPGYSGDNGPATAAGMSPVTVAVDAGGNLLIADNPFDTNLNAYRVRKVDAV